MTTTQSDKCHQNGENRGPRLVLGSLKFSRERDMSSEEWYELLSKGRGGKEGFIRRDQDAQESGGKSVQVRQGGREVQCSQ